MFVLYEKHRLGKEKTKAYKFQFYFQLKLNNIGIRRLYKHIAVHRFLFKTVIRALLTQTFHILTSENYKIQLTKRVHNVIISAKSLKQCTIIYDFGHRIKRFLKLVRFFVLEKVPI